MGELETAADALPESKLIMWRRLKKEGRWEEASAFRDEVIRELHKAGIHGYRAKDIAWDEMRRVFPPLKAKEQEGVAEEAAAEDPVEAELSDEEADAMEEMLENLAPTDLVGDIRWVYGQIENKRARPEQAPSAGAWGLLLWARKYQNRFFEQLLPKALAKGPEGEAEDLRQERHRVEEIEEMIRKFGPKKEDE